MKGVSNKKGLSPVVASVLLILLVIVLAGIIFMWARGFIGEQIEKFNKPIDDVCSEVKFDVARYDNSLEVINKGNVDIMYLEIKTIKGGNSEIEKFNYQIDKGSSATGTFVYDSSANEIIAYPVLIGTLVGGGKNNVYTCTNAGVYIE